MTDVHAELIAIREAIRTPEGREYGTLADSFDFLSAVDCVKKFLSTGSVEDLEDGFKRIERVLARQGNRKSVAAMQGLIGLKSQMVTMPEDERRRAFLQFDDKRDVATRNEMSRSLARIDLVVIAALFEPELSCFLDRLDDCRAHTGSKDNGLVGLTYYTGRLKRDGDQTPPLRVAAFFQDQPGLTDCAALVASSAHALSPAIIAMTGVCAGRRGMKVSKTDLIVPASVFTYDTGKYTNDGFQHEPFWCQSSPEIIRRVRMHGKTIVSKITQHINASAPAKVRCPGIHTDVMACGAAVVDRIDMIDQIAEANRKVVGLDMESYALLRSAQLCGCGAKYFVVKSIMDYATGKTDSLKQQAAFWAAAFLSEFMSSQFDAIVREEAGPEI